MRQERGIYPVGPQWCWRRLEDVVDIETESLIPRAGTLYTYVGLEHIETGTGEFTNVAEVDGEEIGSRKYRFDAEHILYGKLRPYLNKVALPGFDGICSTEILPLRPRRSVVREYVAFWLRTAQFVEYANNHATGTKMPRLGKDHLESSPIPVPPLPVQERIVQILQKADAIRRKRREALELVDKILPALFVDIFGDPATSPKGGPMVPFEQALVDVTRKCRKAQQHTYRGVTSGKWPVIDQGEAYISGYINDDSLVYRGELPVIIFGDHTRRFKFVDFPFVLGADGAKVLRPTSDFFPGYLYCHLQLLRIPDRGYERHFKFLRELFVMKADREEQEYFDAVFRTYRDGLRTLSTAWVTAASTFESLLSRAFTGELTAEWEEANADWIAEQQALYERLSRLVVLALLVERVKQARRAAAETLVTALMKYVFLLQMEGSADRRRLYHFIPYHYGPFSKELYSDLETLKNEGLVRVQHDGEEGKTRITLVDSSKAEEVLASLPEDLKQDVAAIVKRYGDLDHNALLKAVYEKYPAYARRSRLRRKR